MKVHDLKPAAGLEPAHASGSAAASAARAARPPAAAPRARSARDTVPLGLRRRPDAAEHAGPEAEGLQQPVPGRVPGHQPRRRSRRSGLDEVTPEHAPRARASTHKGALVKVLGRGEITRAVHVKAHALLEGGRGAITAAGGSVEVLPLPFGHGRPPAKGNQFTNR